MVLHRPVEPATFTRRLKQNFEEQEFIVPNCAGLELPSEVIERDTLQTNTPSLRNRQETLVG